MILPSSVLRLRQRGSWEALDAGILLWRLNIAPLFAFFGLPLALLAIATRLLPATWWPVSWLCLWYVKPLFDRLILQVASVRFFSPGASFRSIFKEFRASLFRGLVGDLLWRRFSPWRASLLPIRMLEGLKGKPLSRRIQALSRGGNGLSAMLTPLLFFVEICLVGGECFFVYYVLKLTRPELLQESWNLFKVTEPLLFAIVVLHVFLIEGLYVSMAFSLYINSRVAVEGWDLQLQFQGLCDASSGSFLDPEESPRGTSHVTKLPLLLAGLFSLMLFLPQGLEAAEAGGSAGTEHVPLSSLEKVYQSPDFGGGSGGWGIRLRDQSGTAPKADAPAPDLAAWMDIARRISGLFIRGLVVALIATLLIYLGFFLYRNRGRFPGRRSPVAAQVSAIPSRLPGSPFDLLLQSERLYDEGRLREAWAFAVQVLLGSYSRRQSLVFPQGETEYGCLSLATRSPGPFLEDFSRLIRVWVRYAYAGVPPLPSDFTEATALCRTLLDEKGAPDA